MLIAFTKKMWYNITNSFKRRRNDHKIITIILVMRKRVGDKSC